MTDARARELERQARASHDPRDTARIFVERMRAGAMTRELVELCAYLGCDGAFPALGVPVGSGMAWTFPARSPDDATILAAVTAETVPAGAEPPAAWLDGLDRWRPSLCPEPATHQGAARAFVCGAAAIARRMAPRWRRLHEWGRRMGVWPSVGGGALTIDAPEAIAREAELWDPGSGQLATPFHATAEEGPAWLIAPLALAALNVEPGPVLRNVIASVADGHPLMERRDVLDWFRAGALRALLS